MNDIVEKLVEGRERLDRWAGCTLVIAIVLWMVIVTPPIFYALSMSVPSPTPVVLWPSEKG